MVYSIYGEVDEEILVDSFLNFICEDEQETLQNVLATDAKEFIFESEDFLDTLDWCRSQVTKFNARNIIELAKQELIQKPHLMAHSWASKFKYFKQEEDFQSIHNITTFYEKSLGTPKQIIALIEAKPSEIER